MCFIVPERHSNRRTAALGRKKSRAPSRPKACATGFAGKRNSRQTLQSEITRFERRGQSVLPSRSGGGWLAAAGSLPAMQMTVLGAGVVGLSVARDLEAAGH